ncbi:MAG: ROK family protein [Anaerolineae bacterium]|nr:ROK family protein [Anaerolineae bacterium]
MSAPEYAIGVDIGGTKIAFALVDRSGQALDTHQLATNAGSGPDAVIEAAAEGVRLLAGRSPGRVAGVGVGVPGFVDFEWGIVRNAVNLGWVEMPLAARLAEATGLPTRVQNDVNALLDGELRFGAARGCRAVALAAIGTGVGGAFAFEGKVVSGAVGSAGEIGHTPIMPSRRLCRCGLRGCVEAYLSGVGLASGVSEHRADFPASPLAQGEPAAREIVAAADAGDKLALAIMAEALEAWQMVVAVYAMILNPERIVIGGGLGSALAPRLLEAGQQALQEQVLPFARGLTFALAEVQSPAVGAAAAAFA